MKGRRDKIQKERKLRDRRKEQRQDKKRSLRRIIAKREKVRGKERWENGG